MTTTVGDFVWERLRAWGIEVVFGYPGDGINGLLGALNRTKGAIKFVQVRHEEMAAFMASAYSKFSGRLGVCLATSGPGATHLITGMYDARLDHQPLLAIAGQQARAGLGDTSSKRSISRAPTKMWREPMSNRRAWRLRCVTSSIAPFALHSRTTK